MNKKNIILTVIISFAITIIIVGSIIGAVYLKNNEVKKEIKTIPYKLDEMYFNLMETDSIVKCSIVIETTDKNLINKFDEKKYIINHEINLIIRNKTKEDIEGSNGQKLLQQEITSKLVEIFNSEEIANIYFEQLIVQ